jgi:hypothetical protein
VFCFSFESSLFDINHPFCFRGFTYYSYRWRRLFFWVSDIVVSYSLPLPLPLSLFLFFGSSIFCDISEWSFSWFVLYDAMFVFSLQTTALKSGSLRHDIHYWLGKDTSQVSHCFSYSRCFAPTDLCPWFWSCDHTLFK